MSDDIKITIISSITALIVALVTAFFTSKQTIKQEIKKAVYEKREEAYIMLFDLLNSLLDNPYLVFNRDVFLKPLTDLRTKLNLFASQNVLDNLEPFYNKIMDTSSSYSDKFEVEEYFATKVARIEYGDVTESDILREEEEYQKAHLIDRKEIYEVIGKLVAAMRKDMGTK